MNDDYNGELRSRVTYTPTLTDLFQLVVRSYDNGKGGTCDVKQNGSDLGQDVDFGGWHQGGTTSATDVAQTVLVNQGTDDTVLFAFDASGSLKAIDDDSGVGYTSRLTGSYSKYVVSTYGGGAPGSSRLVLNDTGNDSDGDGGSEHRGGGHLTGARFAEQAHGPELGAPRQLHRAERRPMVPGVHRRAVVQRSLAPGEGDSCPAR